MMGNQETLEQLVCQARLVRKEDLDIQVRKARQGFKARRAQQDLLEKKVKRVILVNKVQQANQANPEILAKTACRVPKVHQDIVALKVLKAIVAHQDFQVPRVKTVLQGNLGRMGSLVNQANQEKMARQDIKVNPDLQAKV